MNDRKTYFEDITLEETVNVSTTLTDHGFRFIANGNMLMKQLPAEGTKFNAGRFIHIHIIEKECDTFNVLFSKYECYYKGGHLLTIETEDYLPLEEFVAYFG